MEYKISKLLILLAIILIIFNIWSISKSSVLFGAETTPLNKVINVYPVRIDESGIACAYIVYDGKIWYCTNNKALPVSFN